jgi:hypothetical protein
VEASDWLKDEQNPLGRYEYEGQFKADKFDGDGLFKSRESTYSYKGDFAAGQPNRTSPFTQSIPMSFDSS